MKKIAAMIGAAILLLSTQGVADPIADLCWNPGFGNLNELSANRVLSADTLYRLNGVLAIDSTYSITIPAGTVIIGDSGAVLLIERGAQIFANGTVTEPIVFTSSKPPGRRNRGDWGGIVILGRGITNQANPLIEGGIPVLNPVGRYGGATAGSGIESDNSGVFRYVRIEYPGFKFSEGNEINGLTMGGVGSGTTIEYVQVSYSNDDAYEWFGGTVNCRYLVAYGELDDCFDSDFGFRGNLQFLFDMKDGSLGGSDLPGQTNGLESDGKGSAALPEAFPSTRAVFSNMTLVGPRREDGTTYVTGKHEYGACIRRFSAASVFNSIIMGFRGGLSLRDSSNTKARLDTLKWRCVSLQTDGTVGGGVPIHAQDGYVPAQAAAWFNTTAYNNRGGWVVTNPSAMGLANLSDFNNPDPRPTGSTPGRDTVDFTDPYVSSGFTPVTYRGAFDPSLPMSSQWTAGWTDFNPQYSLVMARGWNGVDATVTLVDNTVGGTMPPPRTGNVYSWDEVAQNYTNQTTLTPYLGYFAKYTKPLVVKMKGTSAATPVSVAGPNAGWVMIGGGSTGWNYVTASGGGTITGTQYRYNAQTQNFASINLTSGGTDDCRPGELVFVKVTAAATLTITP